MKMLWMLYCIIRHMAPREGVGILTILPGLSSTIPCWTVLHWVQFSLMSHLFTSQRHSRGRAGRRGRHGGRRRRRGRVFGDAPRGSAHPAVAGGSMFGWAALAASCRLAGVEGAQGLGLVGLTLPVQQLIQYLRMGGGAERDRGEGERSVN